MGSILFLWALAQSGPGPALAQLGSAGELTVARRLFRDGIDATRAGNFDAARVAFGRSYELVPRPVTLLNLAGAQSQTGFLVDAAESYRHYLRIARDDSDEIKRTAARNALDALEPRIPHVLFRVYGDVQGGALQLDGRPISLATLGQRLPINPGIHSVALHRRGTTPVIQSFEIREGDDRQVALVIPALLLAEHSETAEPVLTTTPEQRRRTDRRRRRRPIQTDEGGGVFSSAAFWVVTTVLVLAGAGVAGWYYLFREEDPAAQAGFVGNLHPGFLTLR